MFWISIGLVIIGPCIYAILNPQGIREFVMGRQARYGSNALVLTLAFLGILVVVNVITFQNPQKWDLTQDKQHTLAPESVAALKSLPQPVTALAFYTSRMPTDSANELLMKFRAGSEGKFDFRFIDPEMNPLRAQEEGVTRDGVIILKMGQQAEMLTFASEAEVTSALVRLMNPDERTIYFLTGHGEKDVEQSGDASMVSIKRTLEGKNYIVKTLNLLAVNKTPDDAASIVIAGPVKPISQAEVALLAGYLQRGGSLIVMSEPPALTNFGDEADLLADMLAEDWGIQLDDNLILDPTVNPPYIAVAAQYGMHPITDKMGTLASVFPQARTLTVLDAPAGKTVTPLILSTDSAWGETTLSGEQNTPAQFDAETDKAGPLTLAAVGESQVSRVVVFGDADFAADAAYSSYGNSDLIINTIDWAVGRETLGITPKETTERSFAFMSQLQVIALALGAVCLIPGLVLVGGLVAWAARRSRG
jgi:ABC-type uncharacterized transport system involved in gliding motility auxiliary subunit